MGARHHVAVDTRNDGLHARPRTRVARALPARNLAIVNGHGGNSGILTALAQDLRADFGLNVCVLQPAALAEVRANSATADIHGGKIETSMMLAIAPQLVRRDLIAQLNNPPANDAVRRSILPIGVTCPGRPTIGGSPTRA